MSQRHQDKRTARRDPRCSGPAGTPAAFDAVKQPGSGAALHLVDGRGIFVAVSAVDVASGAVLFSTPGFEHNRVATVACRLVHPVSGTLQAVVGMLAPDPLGSQPERDESQSRRDERAPLGDLTSRRTSRDDQPGAPSAMTPIEIRNPARRWRGGISVPWPTGASPGNQRTHSSLNVSNSAGSRSDQLAQTTLSIELPAASSLALRLFMHWRVCSLIEVLTTLPVSGSIGPMADT